MSVEFQRPKRNMAGMNLTPLIDVVFQLLIFFMLTSNYLHPSIPVDLPSASSKAQESKPSVATLAVKESGEFVLNGVAVTKSSLSQELERIAKSGEKRLRLRADKGVAYQTILDVLSAGRKAKIQSFDFVYEHEL